MPLGRQLLLEHVEDDPSAEEGQWDGDGGGRQLDHQADGPTGEQGQRDDPPPHVCVGLLVVFSEREVGDQEVDRHGQGERGEGHHPVLLLVEQEVADEAVVEGEGAHADPEGCRSGGVDADLLLATPSGRECQSLEPVEDSQPGEGDQPHVALQERQPVVVVERRLALLELGQEVDEDVGDRDPSGQRQPTATRDDLEEAKLARRQVDECQCHGCDERKRLEGGHGLILPDGCRRQPVPNRATTP